MRIISLAALVLAAGLNTGCDGISSFFGFETPEDEEPVVAFETKVGVRPQDRFYEAANGSWLEAVSIPLNVPVYGAHDDLTVYSEQEAFRALKALAGKLSAGDELPPAERLSAQLFLDYVAPMAPAGKDLADLSSHLAAIDAVKSAHDLAVLWGSLQWMAFPTPISIQSAGDKSTQTYAPLFTVSPELVAIERSLAQLRNSTAARAEYQLLMSTVLKLLGYKDHREVAGRIAELDKQLFAIGVASRRATEDAREAKDGKVATGQSGNEVLVRLTPAELSAKLPQLPWSKMLSAAGMPASDVLFVDHPGYFRSLSKLMDETSIETWKAHAKLSMLAKYSELLPAAYYKPLMTFRRSRFGSTHPVDQRSEEAGYLFIKSMLPAALDQAVHSRFANDADRVEAEAIIRSVVATYQERAPAAKIWGDAALAKIDAQLSQLKLSVGFQETSKSYESLTFEKNALLKNFLAVQSLTYEARVAKTGRPIDPKDHEETLRSYRAAGAYRWSSNVVTISSAMLNPPYFYKAEAPIPVNYGSLGYLVAREITARLLSTEGLLNPSEKASLIARFAPLRPIFVKKFAAKSQVLSDDNLLSQVIPDVLALDIARAAMLKRLEDSGRKSSAPAEQSFFLSFAGVLRQKMTPEFKTSLVTREKPLLNNEQRVDLLMMSSPRFQSAFGLKKSDKLYNEQPFAVW